MIAGTTDFTHQSLDDVVEELKDRLADLDYVKNLMEGHRQTLIDNGYWETVDADFRGLIGYSLKFYSTSIKELTDILLDARTKIELHHVNRIRRLYETANELNMTFGRVWHRYVRKEYGTENFTLLERIYSRGRDMSVNMLDLGNVAFRLNDFVGTKVKTQLPPELSDEPFSVGNGVLDHDLFYKRLYTSFTLDEIKTLCFRVSVKFDDLEGEGISGKIRALIDLVGRHRKLNLLFEVVSDERPLIAWNDCIITKKVDL